MEDLRQEIELKLRGALLRDWCKQLGETESDVEFEDAWCSGWHTLRLSTTAIDRILDGYRCADDCWRLGRPLFYEVANDPDRVSLSLAASAPGLKSGQRKRLEELAASIAGESVVLDCNAPVTLIEWVLTEEVCSGNDAVALLDDAWRSDVVFFEKALDAWLGGREDVLWRIPDTMRSVTAPDEMAADLFIEGAQMTILTDRFERSRAARKRCLAAHGTACQICGMDFGKKYGVQFAGKIEVHHKVPLSEIREDYVVDPVQDLVPVCSNCHTIIHSKPDGGAYAIEEVRAMLAGKWSV